MQHPAEYPWSSYRYNALGKMDEVVVPHLIYRRLGDSAEQRQVAYRELFRAKISEKTLDEVRQATNKAWVLGSDLFKKQISTRVNRPTDRAIEKRRRQESQRHLSGKEISIESDPIDFGSGLKAMNLRPFWLLC